MMLAKRLGWLRKVGDPRSLRSKLLLPILGLMLLSLLGSTGAFVLGTALTRNQLLRQQIAADERHVSNSMEARIEGLETAATLLADDPEVAANIQGKAWDALDVLNNRAVAVRNRFELDLIQLYDQEGRQRANVLLSPLFRESSMLDYVKPGYTVVKVVQDHVLSLNRVEIAGEAGGSVIVGVDLELELHRLVSDYRLFSDLLLSVEGKQVATADEIHPVNWCVLFYY